MRPLRCWLGRHEWVSLTVTVAVWPLHHGYTISKCPDCGVREYSPRYPRE